MRYVSRRPARNLNVREVRRLKNGCKAVYAQEVKFDHFAAVVRFCCYILITLHCIEA